MCCASRCRILRVFLCTRYGLLHLCLSLFFFENTCFGINSTTYSSSCMDHRISPIFRTEESKVSYLQADDLLAFTRKPGSVLCLKTMHTYLCPDGADFPLRPREKRHYWSLHLSYNNIIWAGSWVIRFEGTGILIDCGFFPVCEILS